MAPTVDFYFDYISPYAYFGWRNVRTLAAERGIGLVTRPVVFAALLAHHGQLGPAEIPAKRDFTFRQVVRYAAREGIELEGPAKHPFRTVDALRVAFVVDDETKRQAVIDTLFDAIWAKGIDGGDPEALGAALTRRGFDGCALIERTAEPAVKDALRDETNEAIQVGVFGVPTFRLNGELFWGNDSLKDVVMVLDGKDPLDRGLAERMLSRPSGVVRKR